MIPFPGTFHGGAGDEATVMVPLTRLSLSAISGPLRGRTFPFDGVEMVIGRAENCAVPIPSKGVSRHHARIEFQNGSYWLIPDKTVNGTRLNGVLVQAPCQLGDRDRSPGLSSQRRHTQSRKYIRDHLHGREHHQHA